LSGGQDGFLNRWSASTFAPLAVYNLYEKRTFFSHPSTHSLVSAFGVTDVAVCEKYVLVTGSDGTVYFIQRKNMT
jgi:hypothetical protein